MRRIAAKLRAGGLVPALSLCLAALLWSGAAGAAKPPGPTLVIGVGRDFYDGPDSRAFLHGSTNTWEALTYLDENLRARPWLAESWRVQDSGRTWIFRLRPGVRFHDGSLLTAREAAASVERIRRSPKYDPAGVFRDVVSIQAHGRREVVFRLKNPCPCFANLAAYYSTPIIKPAVFDGQGRITRLIATGPFKVERISRGDSIELSAFDGYWGAKPVYRRVIFRTILDAQTRAMALMAGEVDAVADVGGVLPEQAQELESAPGVILKRRETAVTHYLFFNCRQAPFSQARARLWLAGLLDRPRMVRILTQGAGATALDPYSPLAQDWAFGLIRPRGDGKPPEPARRLIILIHGGTVQRWPYLEIAQVLQEKLARRGWPARIEVKEAGGYYQALKQGRFDLTLAPNTLMTGDPDFFYSYYLAPNAPRDFGWRNQEAGVLIARARYEMDPARRRELYRRLAELVNQELPILPLYHDVSLYAYRDSLAFFEMDHNFRPRLDLARPKEAP